MFIWFLNGSLVIFLFITDSCLFLFRLARSLQNAEGNQVEKPKELVLTIMRREIMKTLTTLLIAFFFMAATANDSAAADSPMAQLQETIDSVLVILKTDSEDKPAQVAKAVGPRFDFEKMAHLTLHKYWKNQTTEDKRRFVELFSKMLERTYITKISLYSSPKVEYVREVRRGNKAKVATRIMVNGNSIEVNYHLHQRGADWKIYDVNVEGVSLVRNYRNQLTEILKNKSFAVLLSKIEQKVS